MMKRSISVLLATLCAGVFADVPSTNNVVVRSKTGKILTPEEVQKRAQIRQAVLESSGGFIYDTRSAVGRIAMINAQQTIPEEKVKAQAARIEGVLATPVKCVTEKSPLDFKSIDAAIARVGGNVTVVLTDVADMPALVSIPEMKCAIVNVSALAKDGAEAAKVENRVMKELSRAVCFCFVIGYSGAQGGLMDPVFSLGDLDKVLVDNIGIAQKMHIEKSSSQFFGMRHYKRTTYAKACQEGWAPPPKDKYQQAIWDKAHMLPTAPLTIEPEK